MPAAAVIALRCVVVMRGGWNAAVVDWRSRIVAAAGNPPMPNFLAALSQKRLALSCERTPEVPAKITDPGVNELDIKLPPKELHCAPSQIEMTCVSVAT